MRKLVSLFLIFTALAINSSAQFPGNPSPHSVFNPAAITASATCATVACPTFTIPSGFCTGVINVTGTNTVLSVVTQVSSDAGTTFGPAIVNVVGLAGTGAPAALTGSVIVANGKYSVTVPGMNRVRFLINTLTGTNVTFKVTLTSACAAQAL